MLLNNGPKNLTGFIKTITLPKGIRRKQNIEGAELIDCNGEEIDSSDQSEDVEIDDISVQTDNKDLSQEEKENRPI